MKKLLLFTVLLTFGAVALAGILPTSRGGTGANITPAAGGVIYSTSSGLAVLANGTAGQVLKSFGTSSPNWGSTIVVQASSTLANSTGLKIPAGTDMTTPEAGAFENDGTHLYWTNGAGSRQRLDN